MPAPTREGLSAWLPPFIQVAADADAADPATLHPAERAAVWRAAEHRVREFAAGRALARGLIRRLGGKDEPIPSGQDRAPCWPDGFVGSISHTRGLCVAAVARASAVHGLGIDVEPDEPLEPELWTTICEPEEAEWLRTQPAAAQGRLARVLFSAKEAVFKCVYPIDREWLPFTAFRVMFHVEQSRFAAVPGEGVVAPGHVEGRVLRQEGRILTAAWITA